MQIEKEIEIWSKKSAHAIMSKENTGIYVIGVFGEKRFRTLEDATNFLERNKYVFLAKFIY